MRIAIIGLGLIGGSVARALAGAGGASALGPDRPSIAAWNRRPDGPRAALAEGVIDAAPAALEEALEGASLVILGASPLACLELLDRLAGPLRAHVGPDATITDTASTKGAIVTRADELGLRFVGGHPMAGRETSGYGASTPDLFVERPWIVCRGRHAADADVERVDALATACGALPVRMDPAAHDKATAAISHMPLVLSAALVESVVGGPAWPDASRLAAGGWRDMSRLARGDAAMAAGIAATNRQALVAALTVVEHHLGEWIADLQEADAAGLEERFRAARASLEGR